MKWVDFLNKHFNRKKKLQVLINESKSMPALRTVYNSFVIFGDGKWSRVTDLA